MTLFDKVITEKHLIGTLINMVGVFLYCDIFVILGLEFVNGWFMGFVINGNIAMRLLLFFLFVFNYGFVDGQSVYVPGEVAKGKTAAYRCEVVGGQVLETKHMILEVSNVKDTNTICIDDFNTVVGNHTERLQYILQEELSDEEWNSIKAKKGYGLTLKFILDEQGKIQFFCFMFWNTDPVFSKLAPDRLYRLEQRFKEALKQILSESAKPLRNIVYLQGLSYKDFK